MKQSIVAMLGWIIPAPLATAQSEYCLALAAAAPAGGLRPRVGGHDSAGEVGPARGRQLDARHAIPHPLHGQESADDAGAGHQHVAGPDAQLRRRQLGHLAGVGQTLLAGGGVGAAAVGDDGLGAAVGQVLLADEQGRRLHPVAGVDRRRRARHLGVQDAHVQLVDVGRMPARTAPAKKPRGKGTLPSVDGSCS